MFGVYILFSENSGMYYVGHTGDVHKRLREHNFILADSFTVKHRPWKLLLFLPLSHERKFAIRLESAIKARKSKIFIQNFLKYPELRQKLLDQILGT